jgi:hypothetical protein
MTVFIAHAEADQDAAESLKELLERRGLHVERETAERGFRPLGRNDAVVALWSKESPFSLYRMQFEKRALDAWAEGRLVLVKLDHQFVPVGLRDLSFVDAGFEVQRELVAWPEVAKRAAEAQRPPAALNQVYGDMADAMGGGAPSPAPAGDSRSQRKQAPEQERSDVERPAERARSGGWGVVAGLGIATVAGGAVATILLAPGVGLDAWGEVIGLGPLATLLALGGIAAAGLVLVVAVAFRPRPSRRKRARAPEMREEASAPEAVAEDAGDAADTHAVFVSYARVDSGRVLPVCDAVKAQGMALWLDHEGIDAGESWAGEIVRAIRAVRGVAVMCSKAAFESDHVKREVFLADRYKKRLVPILLENAPMPDDFEYFFAGVQWLKLHETPEADRPAAMMRALETA